MVNAIAHQKIDTQKGDRTISKGRSRMALPYNEEQGERGKEAEIRMLAWLRFDGLDAIRPQYKPAPGDSRKGYAEYEHDIFVRSKLDPSIRVIVEVKRRGLSFESISDIRYSTVIVDVVSTFTAKVEKPLIYLIVSEDLRAAFGVPVATESSWKQECRTNSKKEAKENYLFCPKSKCISFEESVEYIEYALAAKEADW